MASFGERLRREREMRGVSLDEIAESTKIGTRSLRALEEEDFNKLPGGIFNKGFVRSYAKFLGLDEEQTVADFNSAFIEYERNRTGAFLLQQQQEAAEAAPKESSFFAPVVVVVCLVIVAVGGWKLLSGRISANAESETNAAAQAPAEAEPAAATSAAQPAPTRSSSDVTPNTTANTQSPTGTTAAPNATQQVAADKAKTSAPELQSQNSLSDGPIALEIKATADCWIKITSDGAATEVLLTAGRSKLIHAKDKVELFLGNAGGVQISYNGKDLGDLGPTNQSRRLTFTPQGYE